MNLRLYSMFLLCLWADFPLFAELKWGNLNQKITCEPMADEVNFSFDFINAGNGDAIITDVRTGCGCTIAENDKKIYLQGEKGVVTGVFKTSNKRGVNTVNITVSGEQMDGVNKISFTEKLTLTVLIPELATVSPSILLWKKDSAPTEKKVTIKIKTDDLSVIELQEYRSDLYEVGLSQIEKTEDYILLVKPKSTVLANKSVVTIRIDTLKGKKYLIYAYLIIR